MLYTVLPNPEFSARSVPIALEVITGAVVSAPTVTILVAVPTFPDASVAV